MGAIISGSGSYLPQKILTNNDLEKIVDTSDEWIKTRTGILERRISEENEATSDLSAKAAIKALDAAGVSAEEIDCIIVATCTPDMLFPSTACLVQQKIGAINASAFDVEAACTGFIYGLTIAEQFIMTDYYSKILVIGADALSKVVDYTDRNTCVLFGDGAGAVVLEKGPEGKGILSSKLGADGSGGDLLKFPGGGSLNPSSIDTIEKGMHYIQMEGNDVFKFAVKKMPEAVNEVLEKANLKIEDINVLIPHQANVRIIDSAAKRLKIEKDKVFVNLGKYGNMSGASIPVALDEAIQSDLIKDGDHIVLVGFGAGLTWGSLVIKW